MRNLNCKTLIVFVFVSFLPLTHRAQTPSYFMHNNLTFLWETSQELKVPESVLYDEAGSTLYISNINGKPTAKDGNGFISKVGLNGEILELKWADGMHAPKGMGKSGDYLYVTDIDKVHKIQLASGEIVKSFFVKEAKFLNDIAVHVSGDVFVSDMQTSKIYRIHNNTIHRWLDDQKLKRTNGLYATNDHLYIGMAGQIVRVGYNDKKITPFIKKTVSVDGLERFSEAYFLFSDWQGRVYSASPNVAPVKLLDSRSVNKNAADIEFDPARNILFVPTFMGNTVAAYKVSGIP